MTPRGGPEIEASVFVGTSVDGFIARPDGRFDFLPAEGGEPHGFAEFLASVDVLVMGRNTWDTVLPMDPWPYGNKPVVVLTSRPLGALPPGRAVEAMAGTPAEIASRLAGRGMRRLYVDGGFTIQEFLRAGLVRRLVITRVPVLIGTGIALFGAVPRDIPLRHVTTRTLAGGLVQSEYAIAG